MSGSQKQTEPTEDNERAVELTDFAREVETAFGSAALPPQTLTGHQRPQDNHDSSDVNADGSALLSAEAEGAEAETMALLSSTEGVNSELPSSGFAPDNANLLEQVVNCECVGRYAKTSFLTRWIPEVDPDNARAKKPLLRRLKRRQNMLLIHFGFALLAVAVNLPFTVWALIRYKTADGVGTLFSRDCTVVSRTNSGIHIALNIISTLFLSAGNYCLQVLVAPTEMEMLTAHSKGNYYDIGVHSLRNLRYIEKKRVILWATLGIMSTVLHLLWNSCFFSSIPFVECPTVAVTNDFLTLGDDWTLRSSWPWWVEDPARPLPSANFSSLMALHDRAKNFTRLDNSQCIQRYINPLEASSELVLVTKEASGLNNQSSLLYGFIGGGDRTYWNYATAWICAGLNDVRPGSTCNAAWALEYANEWNISYHG